MRPRLLDRIIAEHSLRNRLFSKLFADRETGCLLWAGARNADGYGVLRTKANRNARVHRLMWEIFNGPIPSGLQLDHLCRVRNCASLAHLELVTSKQNTLRGTGPTAVNAAKTACDNGHEYDEHNTLMRPGGRRCRICHRNRQARYWAQRKARLAAGS